VTRGPSAASKRTIYRRDGGRCVYCRMPLTEREATYDHRVPRAQGGTSAQTNIVLSCALCNQAKANRTAEQWASVPHRKRERIRHRMKRGIQKVALERILGP
jgi:5-methylcytosine-specific restriction endonuclease McrA